MFAKLFPKSFDNDYRGPRLALWLLAIIAAVKALQSIDSLIWTHRVMTGADGIPIDSFAPDAAREVTILFMLLSLYVLVVPLLSALALIRYRTMAPLLYLLLIVLQLGARVINMLHETEAPAPMGFYVNLGILAVTVLGFVLSLRTRKT